MNKPTFVFDAADVRYHGHKDRDMREYKLGDFEGFGPTLDNKNLQHVMECKDGVSECATCGGKEDYLTLDCYGQRLNKHQILYIKHNREDYYNGDWVDTRGQYHITQQGTDKPFCGSSLPYPDVWVDLESATTSSFIEGYSRVTCEKCKRAVISEFGEWPKSKY